MPSVSRRIVNWAASFEDGAIIRAAFFGLLSATAVILYLDYTELSGQQPLALPAELAPILPAFDPSAPGGMPGAVTAIGGDSTHTEVPSTSARDSLAALACRIKQ